MKRSKIAVFSRVNEPTKLEKCIIPDLEERQVFAAERFGATVLYPLDIMPEKSYI